MDKMNELIEKYFRGETSLTDEKELKRYFLSGKLIPEHVPYRPLFEAFDEELKETATFPLKKVIPMQRSPKRFWIQTISLTGIAAAFLLALWVYQPQQKSETYAVISGNRIDDTEFVQKYATEKMNKVNDILTNSMKPMQSIDKVRNSLQPINKIGETKDRMEEIKNKVQYK